MYEFIILAHLMRGPAHGYLIAKIINDIIGPYARISNGRLYPLLSKLEQSGLIAVYIKCTSEVRGDRQLRAYKITEEGKKRFYELMMDTTMHQGEYQKLFLQKTCFFHLLKPIERLHLIDHYINYCQAHVLHLMTEADDIVHQAPSWKGDQAVELSGAILRVMQHSIDQWQQELAWAKSLREREIV